MRKGVCMCNVEYLNKMIELSKKAQYNNETPVGSIVVKNDKIIGCGYNKKIKASDSTAHAEIIAIRNASRKINNWNLSGCELYTTLYPCKMCLEAIKEARIKQVWYILDQNKSPNRKVNIIKIDTDTNVLFEKQLKDFFYDKR